jgi:S1-C subfamily serine protease
MRIFISPLVMLAALFSTAGATPAALSQPQAESLYNRVSQSLVVIQYVWQSELGPHDVSLPGVVIDDHGLVMTSAALFDLRIPEAQMKDFKVLRVIDGQDPIELSATFQGRDDRSAMAFVRVSDYADLKPLKFIDYTARVGEQIYSVGMMPKEAGYKPYLASGMISSISSGERFAANVQGSLAAGAAPVVDADGNGIGFVDMPHAQPHSSGKAAENDESQNATPLQATSFTPSHEFIDFLGAHNVPSGKDASVAWLGIFEMAGLKKEEAAYYGLKSPGIQLMALAHGGPAENAGLKPGQVLVSLNGQPLKHGDTVEQMPLLLRRDLVRMAPGQKITFGVVSQKGDAPKDVVVTLGQSPPSFPTAQRFWTPDLGFGVRDIVYIDRYAQQLDPEVQGVMVSLVKPGSLAQAAGLVPNEFVSTLNGVSITDVADFQKKLESSEKTHPHEAIILLVRQHGQDQTIRIESPQ